MLKYNEPLSRHTSFRIGGPAYLWAEPGNPKEILEAVSLAGEKNKKFVVVGNGTNLLAGDEGFDGVIIHLAGDFERIGLEGADVIKLGSGASLAGLVKYAFDKGLAGCEFLAGIPGCVGGAIFMNAGVRDPEGGQGFVEIKDILLDIEALDLKDKSVKTLAKKDIDFKYRSSGLEEKIILSARFGLKKDKLEAIELRMRGFNKKRGWLTAIGFPNAGSIFKNPSSEMPAGALIESCGLKGKRIGDAEISSVHANIIVNLGKATAKDILGLIDMAWASVKQKFGIELELELKII